MHSAAKHTLEGLNLDTLLCSLRAALCRAVEPAQPRWGMAASAPDCDAPLVGTWRLLYATSSDAAQQGAGGGALAGAGAWAGAGGGAGDEEEFVEGLGSDGDELFPPPSLLPAWADGEASWLPSLLAAAQQHAGGAAPLGGWSSGGGGAGGDVVAALLHLLAALPGFGLEGVEQRLSEEPGRPPGQISMANSATFR